MSDSLWPLWTATHQTPLVHGNLQAKILEWVAIPFSRGFCWSRDQTWVSCIASRFFFTILAIVHLEGWLTQQKFSSLWWGWESWSCQAFSPTITRHIHVTLSPSKILAPKSQIAACLFELQSCSAGQHVTIWVDARGEWEARRWPMVPPQAPYPLYLQSNYGILPSVDFLSSI